VIPAPAHNHWLVRKEAIGVVGAITPWNFPSNMIARKIAPAMAVGCTLVMKPSKETPLSALALGELFQQAGLPDGVVNIVLGDSSEIGKELTENEQVKKITFTGSTKVGMKLYEQAAPTLKKVSLELGGHAPFLVFADADLDLAAEKLVAAKFRNNGQVCTSPNRIFVEESVKDAFTKKLLAKMETVTVGNGLDNPTVGPLINQAGVEKVIEQLEDAVNKGAAVLCGGTKLTEGEYEKGNFFAPTVIDGITPDMTIYYEETFGPVIPLISFTDRQAVIAAANDTEFGLASYFFSTNLQTISAIASAIGLYMMIADQENGPQILATAAKKDQAKIIWKEAKLMVKKSPTLREMIKTRVGDMIAEFNDAEFNPLASDSERLDGLNAHCSLMDEIHSWKGRGGRPLYDVVVDSMSSREQPLILITTTSGTTREDIFDELREEMGDIIDG